MIPHQIKYTDMKKEICLKLSQDFVAKAALRGFSTSRGENTSAVKFYYHTIPLGEN